MSLIGILTFSIPTTDQIIAYVAPISRLKKDFDRIIASVKDRLVEHLKGINPCVTCGTYQKIKDVSEERAYDFKLQS